MKNIFVINGHQPYPSSPGHLNQALFENIVEILAPKYKVKTTIINDGYVVEEEQDKFKWANIVIFQSPVYWFSVPDAFHKYIDKVYAENLFYKADNPCEYGSSGLMNGKKYMYSLTWGAPRAAFSSSKNTFFEGKSPDDVIVALHKTQQFCGLEPIKTFSLFNINPNTQLEDHLEMLKEHLTKYL